jgi:methylenetetrahydrofolate reductase (NADPH)
MAARLFRLLECASVETTPKLLKQLHASASKASFPQATPMFQTCLPGSLLEDLVDQAHLAESLGYTAVPHIPATRFASVDALDTFLGSLCRRCRIDRVLVIGGERESAGIGFKAQLGGGGMPEGDENGRTRAGPIRSVGFADTLALLQTNLLQKHGIRRVCVAGHPDGLPGVPTDLLLQSLLHKQEWAEHHGCEMQIVTQVPIVPPFLPLQVRAFHSSASTTIDFVSGYRS